MMDLVVVASIAASLLGLAGWLVYQVSVARELRAARKETSRFPLYAVRDALVDMHASGELDEKEAAWRNMYVAVCEALSLENEMHALCRRTATPRRRPRSACPPSPRW
jgi:hypothetical protein